MWGIELERSAEIPLKRQIYLAVRDQIIKGNSRQVKHCHLLVFWQMCRMYHEIP